MSILITGGAGYIGSHVALSALDKGHKIVLIDNLQNSEFSVIDTISKLSSTQINFFEVDILDKPEVMKILKKFKIKKVIHLAGYKSIQESFDKPKKYHLNNVTGTKRLIEASIASQVEKFIFSSSASVYGAPKNLPCTEEDELHPNNPYSKSKLDAENICINSSKLKDCNISFSILRYFNPMGSHKSHMIGEDIMNSYNLMPMILKVALGMEKRLNIFGNDFNTFDGFGIRDFIHISDLAECHNLFINDSKEKAQVVLYNLGIGKGYSVNQVIENFDKVSGMKLSTDIKPRRKGDLSEIYADVTKLKKEKYWCPKFDLYDMVKDSWLYAKKKY